MKTIQRILAWCMFILTAFAISIAGFHPLYRLLWALAHSIGHHYPGLLHAGILSVTLNVVCFAAECLLALYIGDSLSRRRVAPSILFILAAPLFFGPTICALLWKPIISPEGLLATAFVHLGWPFPDWTASTFGPLGVIAVIQIWTWGAIASAVLGALTGPDTKAARELYLLDGGRPYLAFYSALRATRADWLFLIAALLIVENLRSFETIYIFGVPGNRISTLSYLTFQASYHTGDAEHEAVYGIALIVINAVSAALLIMLRPRRREVHV
jgi:ABC-type sugar transport system permease subunit